MLRAVSRPLAVLRAPLRAVTAARPAPVMALAARAVCIGPLAIRTVSFPKNAAVVAAQTFQIRAFSDGSVDARKIYVGNLSFKVGSEDLESHFAQFGVVEEAFIVMDRENPGRSRGFGFVVFESVNDANTAISKTNESEWFGRFLRVNLANEKPREQRGTSYGGGGGDRFGGGGGGYGGGGGGYGGGGGGGGERRFGYNQRDGQYG